MNRARFKTGLLLVCLVLAACQQPSKEAEGKRYPFKGKVVSVDRTEQRVTISHDEIPGYMDAMTMPFSLKDTTILPDIDAGDTIQATLFISPDSTWLEDVVITKPATKVPGSQSSNAPKEAEPGDLLPDFSLINQDGKRIGREQYKGKALLLTFIYTRCPLPEYCTLMSDNFAQVDAELRKEPRLYERTHLLSITLDPDYDSPRVLRSYGGAHTGNYTTETFNHWEFATGTKEEIRALAQFFGLTYYTEADQIVHSLRTAVIKPDGRIVQIYRGNDWKPADALRDLTAALSDKQG